MIRIDNVTCRGELGQFRANDSMIGWKSDGEEGTTYLYAVGNVRRAEWLEGKLRVLCEAESEEGQEVLALEGFAPTDFDTLWRHFESYCGVYIKKHRPVAAVSEANFDAAMQGLEQAADQVDASASGSVAKKAREQDLLKKVEGVRDGLEEAVKGDKQALSRVFAANGCERIGRLRLVMDTVQLEVYAKDDRWLHLRNMAKTVESVLRELGTFRLWRPPESDPGNASMLKRQVVWELRRAQGLATGEDVLGVGDCDELQHASTAYADDAATFASSMVNRSEALAEEPRLPVSLGPSGLGGSGPLGGPLGSNGPLGSGGPMGGGSGMMPSPLPAPPPADGTGSDESDEGAGAGPATGGGGGDIRAYEDEEVADPTSIPAAPPGHEDDMRLGANSEMRRLNYLRPDSILEGWVWKRSRILKRWRRRWLVLTKVSLESMKQRGGIKPTESIEAGTVQRVYSADGEVQQPRCFCVVGARRSFYMVCDSEDQKSEWIRMITATLGARFR